jgi:hypothetical protein
VNDTAPLSAERRQDLLSKLATEPSDTKLATEFGISRKTVWRMRQKPGAEAMPNAITPPAPAKATPPVVIPAAPVPKVAIPRVMKVPVAAPPLASVHDVMPKVDVELVRLNTYFAVQLLKGEAFKQVCQMVLTAADAQGVLFRKLQVLDITVVGNAAFVRFRSDMQDCRKVLNSLEDRANIMESGGSYSVWFPNGRTGKFPVSTMCCAPKIGFGQTYAGTRIKRWKQQFAA